EKDLEALAHLAGHQQLPQCGERGRGAASLTLTEERIAERSDQELRLRREAADIEPRVSRGVRAGAEVHPRADVLQARVEKRVGVRAMAVVADQGPAVALRMIVIAAHVAIIDEHQRAPLETMRERLDPCG